jgi:hypothetical protein
MEVWWYSLLLKSLLWIALELKGSGQLIGFHILRRDIDAKDISVQVSLHLHKHPAEAGQAGCGVAFWAQYLIYCGIVLHEVMESKSLAPYPDLTGGVMDTYSK